MSEINITDPNGVNARQLASLYTKDLQDSPEDEKKMEEPEVVIDLPDVEDIPGQENIVPPKMNEFMDTTISSSDEEGEGLFNEDQGGDGLI